MHHSQSAIERLPVPTQAKLRSTQILTSFVQIVSELLQNSLDANASHIEVGLDCKEWACWVSDNGHGIGKEDLEYLFQEGEAGRYSSSKTRIPTSSMSDTTFGFRGEALASTAGMSCLEICSRTSKSQNTWSIIVKGGQILYKGPAVRWKRESSGTTVCVRDAFYNLPVRRMSHTAPSRTWELVRQELETYSLMFPHVSFKMEDTSQAGDSSQNFNHIIRIPKNPSILGTFKYLYGSALTEHVEEVNVTDGDMSMQGFISLAGASSKIYQFLYINRHPITTSDLNRVIESEFASSSFGRNALDEVSEKNPPRLAMRRSPRKGEKKPVYVLNISIAQQDVDNCLNPSKSAVQLRHRSNVVGFLSTTIRSFLAKHRFLNVNLLDVGQHARLSPSPRKRKNVNHNSFGHDSFNEISGLSLHESHQASGTLLPSDLYVPMDESQSETLWKDPCTGKRFVIDLRTGNSFPREERLRRMENNTPDMESIVQQERRRTLKQQDSNASAAGIYHNYQSSVPMWLNQALHSNQAYALVEGRIPSVEIPAGSRSGYDLLFGGKHGQCPPPQNSAAHERTRLEGPGPMYTSSTQEFTRDDLRYAEIINQVDRKFIACRIPKRRSGATSLHDDGNGISEMDSVVVLIDQHAADERVRVERFLKELFLGFLSAQARTDPNRYEGIRTRKLSPPIPVLLTQHEALTLERSQDAREMLRKWGVEFAELSRGMPNSDGDSETGRSTGYVQVLISSIPEIVSDKLLQGDELRDLVKGFLGQIQSGELFSDAGLVLPSEEDQEFFWFKAARHCPRGLLDLINSKACRGAIMFNDQLSSNQCEKLLKQLSETVFPFQCAHGRPSLVPLVETAQLQSRMHRRKKRRSEWKRLESVADA